ncbi:hypothetical protein PVAG01_07044 [Phlyctema vagabunda]|uniref:Uncharacterized protein n=1 Tax=Phlyctema vagabunda TaxID=108571 RepID=A0ABR4PBE0_9HELO
MDRSNIPRTSTIPALSTSSQLPVMSGEKRAAPQATEFQDPMANLPPPPTRTPPPIPVERNSQGQYPRRLTTNALPGARPLYSSATVASSGFTASASSNDLSQPSQLIPRFRQPEVRRPVRITTPTRIPTPAYGKSHATTRRYFSSPATTPKKENIKPGELNASQMLDPDPPVTTETPPIQPAQSETRQSLTPSPQVQQTHARAIPKSKTVAVVSSLTTSLTQASITNKLFRSSRNSTDPASPSSTGDSESPPAAAASEVNLSPDKVSKAQPVSYWSGRFSALHDRFSTEIVNQCLQDPYLMQEHLSSYGPINGVEWPAPLRAASATQERHPAARKTYIEVETEKCKKVFTQLEGACISKAAKQSLWDFQQSYARIVNNEKLLPPGGRMSDKLDKAMWVRRFGRVFSGGITRSISSPTFSESKLGSKTPKPGVGKMIHKKIL